MAGLGVSVAVLNDAGRILLQQREDFAVWGLPGGEIEPGETAAQAAVRETYEETGLEVRLTRLVGLYAMPRWWDGGVHAAVFAAELTGGTLLKQTAETLDAAFFGLEDLPGALLPWHLQRIRDTLAGKTGVAYLQDVMGSFEENLTRAELYRLRDESGLSRHDFLRQMFANFSIMDVLEVDGHGGQ
ncbi:MAG: NUDIX domain-containing protein [Anaerolineae bacterium]|nr:NUDIX domain-containing protein [Anaerolineae bacterium]